MDAVTVLGATGSIGVSTLSVIAEHPGRYRVFALTASANIELLAQQCMAVEPRYAVVAGHDSEAELRVDALRQMLASAGCQTEVLFGKQGLCDVAGHPDTDIVMAAIVGAAGLAPTLAAVKAGKRVLLANKESLVMTGDLLMREVRASGASLLPVDSEHNAIFQCLPDNFASLEAAGVEKILLTGSGGPFRQVALADLAAVTPDQACAHPNWSMGRKISVDSATMMNKGLEFIEARWLFDARSSQIEVVVHPQSIVHSMVQYRDGSVLAQLGNPDMRTPIAHCLAWPARIASGVAPLDFMRVGELSFEAPNVERFPCLKLAIDASDAGRDYPVALNAANEIAVDLFLRGTICYTNIATLIAQVLEKWDANEPESIGAVIEADNKARAETQALARRLANG